MEITLAKAEVKALCNDAKTSVLDLAQRSTRSDFTYQDQQSVADKRREEEGRWSQQEATQFEDWRSDDTRDAIAALDVFGVLSVSLWAFDRGADYVDGVESVRVDFSEAAAHWLAERRTEVRDDLEDRRATGEISGGTRNETFVLFALDTIAGQLAAAVPVLKAA